MKAALIALLCACLVLNGCTTPRLVPLGPQPSESVPAVQAGDRVDIVMKSGERLELRVTEVATGSLTGTYDGNTRQIATADIGSMTVRRFSFGRTAGAVLVTVGVAALALFALAIHALTSCDRDDDCD